MSNTNLNRSKKQTGAILPPNNGNKRKISTNIHTESNTVTENGMMETTVTKIITDNFADGTTSTRKETHTTREEQITVGGGTNLRPTGSGTIVVTGSSTNIAPNSQNQLYPQGNYLDPNSPRSTLNTDGNFIDQALQAHNRYRMRHGAQPMNVSSDLCQVAQNWANHLSQTGVMENSHFGYGENIYWSSATVGNYMRGEVPVDYWYNESSQFDWYKMDFQRTTGAFTQVIWKNTNQFGIAKSSGSKGTYVVAFYAPPGNVIGQFRQNVQRALR